MKLWRPLASSTWPQTPIPQEVNTTQVQSQPWVAKWAAESDTQSSLFTCGYKPPGSLGYFHGSRKPKQTNYRWLVPRLQGFLLLPTLRGASGKFAGEFEVGEEVLPILTAAWGHAQISRDDWIKLRQESRNCLLPAPSSQQVLLLLCSILDLSTPLLQLCWDLSAMCSVLRSQLSTQLSLSRNISQLP